MIFGRNVGLLQVIRIDWRCRISIWRHALKMTAMTSFHANLESLKPTFVGILFVSTVKNRYFENVSFLSEDTWLIQPGLLGYRYENHSGFWMLRSLERLQVRPRVGPQLHDACRRAMFSRVLSGQYCFSAHNVQLTHGGSKSKPDYYCSNFVYYQPTFIMRIYTIGN